jgi:hypothetical protein
MTPLRLSPLGLLGRRRSGWRDPLAGMQPLLRLQTVRSLTPDQITGYRDCYVVSGAGSPAVNGRYYQWLGAVGGVDMYPGGIFWSKTGGNTWPRIWSHSTTGQLQVRAGVSDPSYANSIAFNIDPTTGTWTTAGGGAAFPVPTITLIQEPQYAPIGISATAGAANATWANVLGLYGHEAVQSNALLRGVTRIESGVPVLELDGTDDVYPVPTILSSALDSAGTLWSVFKRTGTGGYPTPIGGGNLGPALTGAGAAGSSNANDYGLGKPGAYAAVNPVDIPNGQWASMVVSWSGAAFRCRIISAGIDHTNSGTLPSGFASTVGLVLGIGSHANVASPVSWFGGRLIVCVADNQYRATTDMTTMAQYGATLFPPA